MFHLTAWCLVSRRLEEENSVEGQCDLVIWQIVDGKPGHEYQTKGLVNALERRRKVSLFEIPCADLADGLTSLAFGSFRQPSEAPNPDLILGAGHKTHLSVLAARRTYGGKSVVLMKPSIPSGFFDCVVIPEHDRPGPAKNIISTVGVLNTIELSIDSSLARGLILIGGPSKHHGWDDESVLAQLGQVLEESSGVSWCATTSRRTPKTMVDSLLGLAHPRLEVTPFDQTEKGWVRDRLAECGRVWVSEDSVSMVFESLTSGAHVGLLRVPRIRKRSRVYSAIDGLREREAFVDIDVPNGISQRGGTRLAEADRVAEELLERFHF